MSSIPTSSSSRALKTEEKKPKHRGRSGRSKSPHTPLQSMSTSRRDKLREESGRPKSPTKPPLSTITSRRARRPIEYISDNRSDNHIHYSDDHSKGYQIEYESPTESLSSSLSSFPVERNISTAETYYTDRQEKDHLKDDNEVMNKEKTTEVLSSENGAMIEVSKITALVEEELQSQRHKHKDQLNRTVAKFKDRKENFQREIDQLRRERDEARRELENCKSSLEIQKLTAERNDLLQSRQKNRIEIIQEQKELFDFKKERDALLDEVARAQQLHQNTKDDLSALKLRVREDSQKRLSVMECLSTSWDSEKKEAQQREALLNSELEVMSKTLKAEQEFFKNKNTEFAQLEAQYRLTKTELHSMKMRMGVKNEGMDEELKSERELRKHLSEEHKNTLKLKNQEIYMAETTIRSMRAELKSSRENFSLKEESMVRSIKEMKMCNEKVSIQKNELSDPEVEMIREENSRLNAEIKELQKQVESYLANMALQQEFCNSLKSRIYKEQENEHEQVEEMHQLRKQIKKQQKEFAEKDRHIDQLNLLLENCSTSTRSIKVKSKSSRNVTGEDEKKSKLRKRKPSSSRKSGYRTS